jgi:hypothetical protein
VPEQVDGGGHGDEPRVIRWRTAEGKLVTKLGGDGQGLYVGTFNGELPPGSSLGKHTTDLSSSLAFTLSCPACYLL